MKEVSPPIRKGVAGVVSKTEEKSDLCACDEAVCFGGHRSYAGGYIEIKTMILGAIRLVANNIFCADRSAGPHRSTSLPSSPLQVMDCFRICAAKSYPG